MERLQSSYSTLAYHDNSLRGYEEVILGLRQENIQLRLRLYFTQQKRETPVKGHESEFQRDVAEQIQKFEMELREMDGLINENRKKREGLQRLLNNMIMEKYGLQQELRKWKAKARTSEAAQNNLEIVRTLSHVEKYNKELKEKAMWLTQRIGELEDKEVPTLKRQLDIKTTALQALSAHAAKQENVIESLRKEQTIWPLIQPKIEAFLHLIEDCLGAGDIQATLRAKTDFQRELSKIANEHCRFQQDSTEHPCSIAAVNNQVWKLETELQSRANLIECLNGDIACLTSRLGATQTRCQEYETEMKRAFEIHQKICDEKDKLLDSVQRRLQEIENHAQDELAVKTRMSELKSECNQLHIAVREKSSFINELLSERSKAMAETEKSFQELLLSLKQKDELIEVMQANLGRSVEGGDVVKSEYLRLQNLTDFVWETCEDQPRPAKPEALLETKEENEESSPDSSLERTLLCVSQDVLGEVKVLCQILSDLAQESGILPELSTFELTEIACIQNVTEVLRSAHKKGLKFSLPTQSTIVSSDCLDHCGPDQSGLAAWQHTVLVNLGEKIQQLAYLFAVDGSMVSKWQVADVVQLLDTILERAKQKDAKGSFLYRSPEDLPLLLLDKGAQPKEHEELTHPTTSPHLQNERDDPEVLDYHDELLEELGSALKCVGDLHNEVSALRLTPTSSDAKKPTGSTDELIFAVDSSGQLVPVPAEQAGHFAKDVSSQTEQPRDNLESLKSELITTKAQVKFLQKSLKDSFSVKITESSTGPNAQPLIEIDQNVPVLGSLSTQSPRKSGLSANRRWRKQLTNQKMSEFGLSENVFELQEEIFFLVLRIEDLERQLKDNLEVTSKHKDESLSGQASPAAVQALEKKNAALQEQLHEMQEVSTVLLCRLEELAAFLEQLLAYDETGSLGSVTLSADMVAKIRQLVADSKDFSFSCSQSILGCDNSSSLSNDLLTRGSLDRNMQSILSLSKGKRRDSTVIDKPPRCCKLDISTIPHSSADIFFMEDELKILRDQVQQQQSEILSLNRRLEECSERASSAAEGRSKRAVADSHTKAQKLEKHLRRVQHCNSRLENTLTVHEKLCEKLLGISSGDRQKSATEPQLPKDLIDSLAPSMHKLQFRLEEMFINNERLQDILTEHLVSGRAVSAQPGTSGGAGADSKGSAAEQLSRCKKELECKERREDILNRAMVREQIAKLQLEKELVDCQNELQSLHEAHCALDKEYKAAVQRNLDLALKEPQHHSSFEKPTQLEMGRGSSFERPDEEEIKLKDENRALAAELRQQAQEIARLSKEEALHRDEVSNLSEEKTVLSQKLETVHHDHEVLLESSSNKISELVTKLGALSTQNKNQQEEIRNLREMGESISQKKIKLEHDLDAAFSELEGLRVENQDMRETLLALRKQENLVRESLEKALNKRQAAKKICAEYSQSNKLLRMEKDQLTAKISDLSSHLDSLESEKQSLYEEKQRLILEVSAGEDEVERVNSKLHSCEEECNNLRTEKNEVEAELQACNNKLQECEHLAEQLREELSATKVKLENMDIRCNHLEQELRASKEAHKQLLGKRDELQRALEAVGREAQQSKSFARMSLDKKHVIAFMELQDQNRSLQNVVMELKLKLERTVHENKCLSLELRANEQFQPGNSSGAMVGTPDSTLSFVTAASSASPPQLSPHLVPVDSSPRQPVTAPVIGQHSCSHSRSYHTSPDLGIDSDPTPEHDVCSTPAEQAAAFVEHWQHRMGPDWSITVHSAPDAIGGSCLLCLQDKDNPASWKLRANATYGGEQLDQPGTQSPSKSGFPVISCTLSSPGVHLCAIVQLSDHELLKKRVDESICLIRRVEASVQQALDALADFASDCTEPPECNRLLQDAERGCQNIKICLMDSFKLICSFTMAQVPEAKEEHSFEHKQLRVELNKLQEKHSLQSAELQNALDQISSLQEKKEGMERAISRQLSKTKMVLKQTKGNLNVLRARDTKPEKK